jgi:hypothetical protein
MPIEFSFGEVLNELEVIEHLAEPLLEPDDLWKLDVFGGALKTIRANRVAADWSLAESNPLRTRASGEYERLPRHGTYPTVHGEFSAIWQIQPIATAKAAQLPAKFTIVGKASTKLRLVEEDEGRRQEFLLWRMEISAGDSPPGSFFHIQLGEDLLDSSVYQPLPVPRIPCPPASPFLALEYMLAELFQDAWPQQLTRDVPSTNQWANLQRPRLQSFFGWQQETLRRRGGSPVTDLKHAIPRQDLLTDTKGCNLR